MSYLPPSVRRVDLLLAVAHVACDYHSGQNSRGYRLLCRTLRALSRRGVLRPIDRPLAARQTRIYRRLAAKYGDVL